MARLTHSRGDRPIHRAAPRSGPWKHGRIPVVGLVGGIGAGKSLVASELGRRGAVVLDADAVGHSLLQQTPTRQAVIKRFGPEILDRTSAGDAAPRIDRKALGALVFADRHSLRDLEHILHPRMRGTFERAIARAVRKGGAKAVVLDAAILFEAGWDDLCDLVVFVDASREQRLERVGQQRGWTSEALDAREAAQMPLDEKRSRSTVVLRNALAPEQVAQEVDRLCSRLVRPGQGWVRPERGSTRPGVRS
jgi:dephospho-CoA kinase